MEINCISRTHVGLRRKLNEDSLLNCPERLIWAVADGMGGHEAGEVASALVVKTLDALAPCKGVDDALHHSTVVLQSVNAALLAMAEAEADKNRQGHKTIGSTVVGLVVDERQFGFFWAGDSRGYLLRDGALKRITRDHSMVQELVDNGLLPADQAEGHPNSNVITRAVGAAAKVDVETVSGARAAGDLFLLASDGLTRLVPDDELEAHLRDHPLDQVADRLLALTLERGAPDNVTLLLVQTD